MSGHPVQENVALTAQPRNDLFIILYYKFSLLLFGYYFIHNECIIFKTTSSYINLCETYLHCYKVVKELIFFLDKVRGIRDK